MSKRMKAFLVVILIGGIVMTGVGLALAGNSRNSIATSQGTGNRYGVEGKHNGYRMTGDKSMYRYRMKMGEEIASYLGITEDELRAERVSGKSLAEIAEANGKTEEGLINFITGKMTEQLNTLLNEGKIDETRYETMLNNINKKVKEMVERTEVGPMNGGFRSYGFKDHSRGLRPGIGKCNP